MASCDMCLVIATAASSLNDSAPWADSLPDLHSILFLKLAFAILEERRDYKRTFFVVCLIQAKLRRTFLVSGESFLVSNSQFPRFQSFKILFHPLVTFSISDLCNKSGREETELKSLSLRDKLKRNLHKNMCSSSAWN